MGNWYVIKWGKYEYLADGVRKTATVLLGMPSRHSHSQDQKDITWHQGHLVRQDSTAQ